MNLVKSKQQNFHIKIFFDDHRLNIMVEIMDSRDEIGVTEQVW